MICKFNSLILRLNAEKGGSLAYFRADTVRLWPAKS